jgi:hypothetical protein
MNCIPLVLDQTNIDGRNPCILYNQANYIYLFVLGKRVLLISVITYIGNIVKPVLRGHLSDKEKLSYKTGSIHMKFSTRQEKGDLLIQVTA